MLSKFTKVTKEGVFSKHGNEKVQCSCFFNLKVVYASMMVIRKLLVYVYPRAAMQSLTIAVRYSICR